MRPASRRRERRPRGPTGRSSRPPGLAPCRSARRRPCPGRRRPRAAVRCRLVEGRLAGRRDDAPGQRRHRGHHRAAGLSRPASLAEAHRGDVHAHRGHRAARPDRPRVRLWRGQHGGCPGRLRLRTQGLQDLSGIFSAPLSGYDIPLPFFSGANGALWHAAIGYQVAGIVGILLVAGGSCPGMRRFAAGPAVPSDADGTPPGAGGARSSGS